LKVAHSIVIDFALDHSQFAASYPDRFGKLTGNFLAPHAILS